MSYYAADANGYLDDVANISSVKALRLWSKKQAPVIRDFFETGASNEPKVLAHALRTAVVDDKLTALVRNLAALAEKADELLILTDGNNGG